MDALNPIVFCALLIEFDYLLCPIVATTDIEYRSYQLSTSNGISEKVYGPAFNKKMTKELAVPINLILKYFNIRLIEVWIEHTLG